MRNSKGWRRQSRTDRSTPPACLFAMSARACHFSPSDTRCSRHPCRRSAPHTTRAPDACKWPVAACGWYVAVGASFVAADCPLSARPHQATRCPRRAWPVSTHALCSQACPRLPAVAVAACCGVGHCLVVTPSHLRIWKVHSDVSQSSSLSFSICEIRDRVKRSCMLRVPKVVKTSPPCRPGIGRDKGLSVAITLMPSTPGGPFTVILKGASRPGKATTVLAWARLPDWY